MFHVLPFLTISTEVILSETKLESGKIKTHKAIVVIDFDKTKPNTFLISYDTGKDGITSHTVVLGDTNTYRPKNITLRSALHSILNKLFSTQVGISGVTLASLKMSGFLSKDFSLSSIILSEIQLKLTAEGFSTEQIEPYLDVALQLPDSQVNQILMQSLARRTLGLGLDPISLPAISASSVIVHKPEVQGNTDKEQLDGLDITGKETTEPEQKNNRLTRNRKTEETSLEKQLENLAIV